MQGAARENKEDDHHFVASPAGVSTLGELTLWGQPKPLCQRELRHGSINAHPMSILMSIYEHVAHASPTSGRSRPAPETRRQNRPAPRTIAQQSSDLDPGSTAIACMPAKPTPAASPG